MQISKGVILRSFAGVSLEIASLVIEANGRRILIDPGRNEQTTTPQQLLPLFETEKLDAIVLTHYHGDHSNLVADILKTGAFNGPVVGHAATVDICKVYYNLHESANNEFIGLAYETQTEFLPGISLALYDAGHVLGSSILYFTIDDKTLVVTGDLGAGYLPIVRDPATALPQKPIDLLVTEAKQAGQQREIDLEQTPLGDIIYRKLQDCFLFDDGSVLIFAPLVQIPVLLYCLNYIFNNAAYAGTSEKITAVYLDPQPKLLELLRIFESHESLLDQDDAEYVPGDQHHFRFGKLRIALPEGRHIRRSIIITPNRDVFVHYFKLLRQSVKNDVLLLNQNIFSVLNQHIRLIDSRCDMQIKRLPFLHYHPDQRELTAWYKQISRTIGIERLLLYHYYRGSFAHSIKQHLLEKVGGQIDLIHKLVNDRALI
ncbi:MBL fold metallo-hydrolase [candidate division KSB1 bacterium]|nr:MBL fold metallo-hydrolase [candidate division KSB1 bacterium]